MPQGYQIYNQQAAYFLTFQVVEWVDVFTRPAYKNIVTDCFNFCRKNKGLQLFGYVIMTNHVHLIARAKESCQLSDIVRDFKKFTANQILPFLAGTQESRRDWMLKRFGFGAAAHQRNSHYQFWTHENHAIELISAYFAQQKLAYIHNNPVRAAIVDKPEDYLYTSAMNYAGRKGLIEIDLL
ncbi:REP-associated tyrosine transposase [Parasediminibacterium sp. JCM 36343]|uniref:REP-associated tyrosine transposase n=1 Tax=Parasediminibacterium sp. JCM 36343 TaxID=3374279 RepID=UPI00397CF545